eukprot:1714820-Amphidinium_carterae.1
MDALLRRCCTAAVDAIECSAQNSTRSERTTHVSSKKTSAGTTALHYTHTSASPIHWGSSPGCDLAVALVHHCGVKLPSRWD